MTKEEIQQLYKQHIIPESKAPYRFFVPENYTSEILAYNPLCGDKYHLYQTEEESNPILQFHGIGCALSQASCSLLIRASEGLQKQELIQLIDSFLGSLSLENEISNELPESIKILAALKNFEGRVDCIRLPWQALFEELAQKE